MKKVLTLLLIAFVMLSCGFKNREKPYIVLSNANVNTQAVNRLERVFSVGQRVHYAVVVPQGFKYSGVRMQISKQDDKTSNWGFSIISTEDIYVAKSDTEYRSYIVPKLSGHYIIQFFYLNNKRYPFAHKEFIVQ